MRKQLGLLLIALFSISLSHAQDEKFEALPMVVFEMAAHNVYESETIGIANAKSKQFARYQQLVAKASEEQLLELTAHTNAVVRLYAYQALRAKGISLSKDLQQKFKDDSTSVQSMQGCVINKYPVSKLASTPLSSKSYYSRQNMMPIQFVGQ